MHDKGERGERSMLMCFSLGHILLLSDSLATSVIPLFHRDRPWPSHLWPGVSVSGTGTVF